MTNIIFRNLIRVTRQSLGKSLRSLSEEIKISPSYLSRMERGEFPPPSEDIIIKIAKALSFDSDELLGLVNKIDPALKDIINEEPKLYAAFLRKATIDDLKKLITLK